MKEYLEVNKIPRIEPKNSLEAAAVNFFTIVIILLRYIFKNPAGRDTKPENKKPQS